MPNIRNQVVKLTKAGVTFETYPFLEQNELNIWQRQRDQVAWFKDPDGNLLSITQWD